LPRSQMPKSQMIILMGRTGVAAVCWLLRLALLLALAPVPGFGQASPAKTETSADTQAIPGVRALMAEVVDHQKQLEKIRENYTYRTVLTDEEMDSNGQLKKTETEESEVFFVNTHRIDRKVKKNGKPLDDHERQKEQNRVNKLVEKAQNTPPGQPLDGQQIVSITHLLDIMDVTNPRRAMFRGRSTILFDFAGRRAAQTHGMAEDASKKLAGTLWVDEKDREVAHIEVHFTDNFRVAGGLLANVQKGSRFVFDQAPVNGEIWFPTFAEGRVEARVLLFKGMHEHVTERDSDYERFTVDTETGKMAMVVPDAKK
jgi:hypothetical protein